MGFTKPTGALKMRHITPPGPGLMWKLNNLPHVWRGWWRWQAARALGTPTLYGRLRLRHFRADGSITDYGLVSTRVVTTAFVNFLVDELQAETSEWGDFKYHDCGTGSTGAAVGDTAMETQYGGARSSGTQTEGAANIYESVGTVSFTSSLAITEHGLFSQSTGTTLMDRHVFSAVNVVNGDSINLCGLVA